MVNIENIKIITSKLDTEDSSFFLKFVSNDRKMWLLDLRALTKGMSFTKEEFCELINLFVEFKLKMMGEGLL